MVDSKKRLVAARQKARHYAVQALYQWQMNTLFWSDIASQFLVDYTFNKQEETYFKQLLRSCVAQAEDLDALIEPHLDRKLSEVGPVEISILRLACYELKDCSDVPYRVVINESVNLAKKFAATDGHKFVNGVLDRIATQLRSVETGV